MKLFCPSCGSPVEFRFDDSFVRVCGACRSAIARTDRGIDTLGQFADLAPAASGVRLSAIGRWQGQGFTLMGRAEYAHPAGGGWEEWYLKLADGRWAWLSHAHGTWALTFRSTQARALPAFEHASPGMSLTLGGGGAGAQLTVGERSTAQLVGAEGELPFLLQPGASGRFVDASDEKGRFATIDYGPPANAEAPTLYLGRRTSLAELELGVAEPDEGHSSAAPQRAGERLGCPNCGGGIVLRVPERSSCVTCSYCGSLLDCEGPLAILAKSDAVPQAPFDLELGAVGTFEGTAYTVTGRLRRRANYPGGFVEWDEYLLYAREPGYRWLVCAEGHYSFVTPLDPGAVEERERRALYRGRSFLLFDRGSAEVVGVWGEFYWKVQVGESVATADYVAPPAMLSRESTADELHWSLGIYQDLEAVRRAFGATALRDERRGVAPHQPFRHRHWRRIAGGLALALIVGALLRGLASDELPVYAGHFQLGAAGASDDTVGAGQRSGPSRPPYVFFTPPFELRGRRNVEVELSLPLRNDWAFVVVDLVHEASGELRTYGTELSYYSGVAGGERWSEGSRLGTHVFGAGQAGSHVLRLEVQTPLPSRQTLKVAVTEDVFAARQLGWALLLLGVPSGLLLLMHYLFERWRWSESDFAPSGYASSDE